MPPSPLPRIGPWVDRPNNAVFTRVRCWEDGKGESWAAGAGRYGWAIFAYGTRDGVPTVRGLAAGAEGEAHADRALKQLLWLTSEPNPTSR